MRDGSGKRGRTGRWKRAGAIAAVAMAALMAVATAGGQPRTQALRGSVTIGGIYALTGSVSIYGIPGLDGVKAGVGYVNAHGGINGKRLVLKTIDDQSRPEVAVAGVQQFAANKSVVAILGPETTGTGYAGGAAANQSKIPMITPIGDATDLYPGPYVFRTAATFKQHAEAIMRYCKQYLRRGVIGLEYQTLAYGNAVSSTMSQEAAAFGVRVIQAPVDPTATDVTSTLQQLISQGANVIVSINVINVGGPVNNWKSLGAPVPLVLGIGASSPLAIANADAAAHGVSVLSVFTGDDPLRRQKIFDSYYTKLHHATPQFNNATGWDAVMILTRALKSIRGTPTRPAIDRALQKIHNYSGAAGIISFSQDDHQGFEPQGFEWTSYQGDGHYKFLTTGLNPTRGK